jgi:hypothetical protein
MESKNRNAPWETNQREYLPPTFSQDQETLPPSAMRHVDSLAGHCWGLGQANRGPTPIVGLITSQHARVSMAFEDRWQL